MKSDLHVMTFLCLYLESTYLKQDCSFEIPFFFFNLLELRFQVQFPTEHYAARISNIAYHLTHRSGLETAHFCIFAWVTSFVVSLLTFFVNCFDMIA